MPSEVKNKTDDMESLVKWGITIGGIVVIALCLWAIHKNKGQGGWVEYVCWSLVALAMFVVLITWWVAKSNSATASLVF
jgi:steroid 5-alpha reductase family enzyme